MFVVNGAAAAVERIKTGNRQRQGGRVARSQGEARGDLERAESR